MSCIALVEIMEIPNRPHHHVRLNSIFRVSGRLTLEWSIYTPSLSTHTLIQVGCIMFLGLWRSLRCLVLFSGELNSVMAPSQYCSQRDGTCGYSDSGLGTIMADLHIAGVLGRHGCGLCSLLWGCQAPLADALDSLSTFLYGPLPSSVTSQSVQNTAVNALSRNKA